jgi:deazaflavin-dependent oxidoreductase (nitroreductase family)
MNIITPKAKDALFKAGTSVHNQLYRRTGGRVGAKAGRIPMLLLTTTGRKTGQPRTTPLGYLSDGDRMVVVASYGGDDRHPQWYLNLQANPEATVQAGARTQRVRAATATAEEKAELWPRAVALNPGYAGYQQKTTRDIPLVILTPV